MTSDNNKELMRQRRNAKGRVTRLTKKLDGLVENSPEDIEEMMASLTLLDDSYNKAEAIHEEVNLLTSDDEEEADRWIDELYEKVCATRLKVRAHTRKSKHGVAAGSHEMTQGDPPAATTKTSGKEASDSGDVTTAKEEATEGANSTMTSDAAATKPEATMSDVARQPVRQKPATTPVVRYRLELPRFSGALKDYRQFKTTFKTLVDPDATDNNTKLHVLRGRLAQVPAKLICNIEEYDEAWRKLDLTYGRNDQLTDVCFKELEEMKPVRKGDAISFLDYATTVQDVVTQLKNAGCNADLDSTGLLKTITKKMCDEDRERWGRDVNGGHAVNSVRGLNAWLEEESIIKSQAYSLEPRKPVDTPKRNNASFNAAQGGDDTPREKKCPGCKENHHMAECGKFKEKSNDDRWKAVKELRCCFSCLKPGHSVKDCRSKKDCGQGNCTKKHHSLLHKEIVVATSATCQRSGTVLPVIRALVKSANGKEREGNLLIDSGAQLSLIRRDFAKSLGLQGQATHLNLSVVGGKTKQHATRRLELQISTLDGSGKTYSVEALELDQVCADVGPLEKDTLKHEHLQDINLSYKAGPIDILVGVDYPHLHVGEIRKGTDGTPVAIKSPLGWMLFGPNQGDNCTSRCCSVLAVADATDAALTTTPVNMTAFWETESFGTTVHPCTCKAPTGSQEDRTAAAMLKASCKKIDGRYEIALPWKHDAKTLPNNKTLAMKRLESTERKLTRNPDFAESYDKQIMEYEKLGFARKLAKEELTSYEGPTYYIAHHAVIRADKSSTPIRIVFDSSAKFKGGSLNDHLMKGPDLLNSLFGVILRFRENEVAVCTDISKMFSQIKLPEHDQQVHRFLWRNMDQTRDPDTYMMLRVPFGDKPAPAMAQTVLWQTAEDSQKDYPAAATSIKANAYMDDICDSVKTKEDANRLTSDITEVLRRGGFSLKKWISNRRDLDAFKDTAKSPLKEMDHQHEKILGAVWNPVADSVTFAVKEIAEETLTKRSILSKIAQVFDPIGFAAAFLVRAKTGMQQLWTEGVAWDDPVSSSSQRQWQAFFQEMKSLQTIEFPRCLTPQDAMPGPTLHVFCDASDKAFASCAYVRWERQGQDAELRFVAAKTRVAPLKKLSIPRLELQAAVLGTRLAKTIIEETRLNIANTTYWSDSMVVLSWIKSNAINYKPFVSVRIGEIQADSDPASWRHCPTEWNCADDASRGIKVTELAGRWCNGADFLKKAEDAWPQTKVQVADGDDEKKRMRIACPVSAVEDIMNPDDYSDWRRLQRVTAYVIRFTKQLQKKTTVTGPLDCDELQEAETYWVRAAQRNMNDGLDAGHFQQLTPFTDDTGIIRVGGRVDKADLPYDQRHPVLLPRKHSVSRLLMKECHRLAKHPGSERVLAQARLKYWIIQGRTLAKSIGDKCVRCRWLRAAPQQQQMAELPEFRLKPFTPPFYYVGTDYFGPIVVKIGGRSRREKRYGALFTCLNTRAVHVEVATDMSTPAFLQALRRFYARRGHPRLMLSDNGKNFVGAEKELKQMVEGWDQKQIQDFAAEHQMKWQFNTPLAPHHGGVFEAMVKLVKKALKATVGEQVLSHEELCTYLCEVENLVNSRPLGPMSSDPNDGAYITPNHLLLGRASAAVPQGPFTDSKNPRLRFQFVQGLVNKFWKKWTQNYLPTLMARKKWRTEKRKVTIGDVVLVIEQNQPRGKWQMGRVTETYAGNDGLVRSVKVKTKSNDYVRPITKLCMLMPQDDDEDDDESTVATASMGGGMFGMNGEHLR